MASQAGLDLVINIKGDADKRIGGLSKSIAGLGKSAVGVGATITKAFGGIALGGVIAGVAGLGAALVGGISDAREAAIVFAQTEAVLKSTGGASGKTAEQISELAASLSAASGASLFGDDLIQQSSNLLLTFTNLKGGVLDAATAISVDMAQALGGAPADAAVQLGKALNDPIKGISALTRVGVTFTEEQKNLIASLVETGDMAGAQQVILAELNKEFGGSAAAAAAADGGFAQFQDRMGELAESVGTMVLPALNSLMGWLNSPEVQAGIEAFVGGLVTGLTNIATFIGTNVLPVLSETIGRIGEVLTGILTPIRDVATAFNEWKSFGTEWGIVAALEAIGDAFPAVQPVTDWLASVMPGAVQNVREAFGLARDALQTFKDALAGDWKNAEQIHPLHAAVGEFGLLLNDTIIPALGDLVKWVGTNTPAAWETFKKSIDEDVMPALRVLGSWFEEKTPVIDTHTGKVVSGTSAWDRYAERLSHNFGIIKTEFDTFITNLQNKTRQEDEETKKQTDFWENYKTSLDNWLIFLQNDFNTFTTTIGGHMDRMNQDMNTSLTNAVAAVALFVGDAITVIGTMPGLIKAAVTTWGSILKAAGVAVIQGFIDGVKSMIPTISQVLGGITALIPKIKGPPAEDAKLLFESGRLIIGGLIDGFGSMTPNLVKNLSGVTELIGGFVGDAVALTGDKLRTSVENVEAHLRKFLSLVQEVALGAGAAGATVAAEFFGGFVNVQPLEQIADKIKTMLGQTIPADAIPFAGELGGNLGAAFHKEFKSQIDEGIPGAIAEALGKAARSDKNSGGGTDAGSGMDFGSFVTQGSGILGDAAAAASDIGSSAGVAFVGSMGDSLELHAPVMVEDMKTTLKLVQDQGIIPWAAGVGGRLKLDAGFWSIAIAEGLTGNKSAIDAAKGMGDGIAGGIASGIDAGIPMVTAAAESVARAALDAAMAALGISSPSKLFADEVGVPMAEGMAEGFTSETKHLGNVLAFAAQALAQQAADAAVAIAVEASAKLAEAMASGSEAAIASAQKAAEEAMKAAQEATDAIGGRVLDSLFNMGSTFSSVGGFAGGLFRKQQLDPVTKRLKAIADEIKEIDKQARDLTLSGGMLSDSAEGERLEARKAELLREQTAEKEKQAVLEARLLKLQEQQQMLGWMQQQQKLVDMISQYGLDPTSILGDLQLGAGASVEGIMEAMTRAMAAIIAQINERMGGGAAPGPGPEPKEDKTTNNDELYGLNPTDLGPQLQSGLTAGLTFALETTLEQIIARLSNATMPNLMTMPALPPVGIGPGRAGVTNIYNSTVAEGAIQVFAYPGQDTRQLARDVKYEMDKEMERRRNR